MRSELPGKSRTSEHSSFTRVQEHLGKAKMHLRNDFISKVQSR